MCGDRHDGPDGVRCRLRAVRRGWEGARVRVYRAWDRPRCPGMTPSTGRGRPSGAFAGPTPEGGPVTTVLASVQYGVSHRGDKMLLFRPYYGSLVRMLLVSSNRPADHRELAVAAGPAGPIRLRTRAGWGTGAQVSVSQCSGATLTPFFFAVTGSLRSWASTAALWGLSDSRVRCEIPASGPGRNGPLNQVRTGTMRTDCAAGALARDGMGIPSVVLASAARLWRSS